jgi:hypothetical protein
MTGWALARSVFVVKVINHYGDEVLKVFRVPDVSRGGAPRALPGLGG